MIIKSETMGYNEKTAQYLPKYQLDTDNACVAEFNEKARHKSLFNHEKFGSVSGIINFHTGYVADHLKYAEKHSPERLQQLVNEGKIIEYLEDIENRAFDAVENQVDKWKESDKEYQLAKMTGDIETQAGLENNLVARAKELIYPTIIYV